MTSSPLPRILRRRGEPGYPTFLELFFDVTYIFMLSRIAAGFADDLTVRGLAEATILLLAAWWVWVLTAWLTDLFNPRLPIIQATVLLVMFGTLVMAIAVPQAFGDYGWLLVAAYFGIHVVRDAVLIPGTRANRSIQARSVRVFFWFLVTAAPWAAGAFVAGWSRLALWGFAVLVDLGSARIGWPTPRLGRTELSSQIFTGSHLSERYRQIFLIALGELILTVGVGLSANDLGPAAYAACAVAFTTGILVLQLYYQRVRQLLAPSGLTTVERVRPGTSTSYTHLVMVGGVLLTSTGLSLVIAEPLGSTPAAWTAVVLGGPALFLVGSCLFDAVLTGRLLWSRALGVVALGALAPALALLPPLGVLVVANLVLLLILVGESVAPHSRLVGVPTG
ncbi:low temperature requirement protein A [Micromonospora avicenniae]|uniref:Low temperature requirement protein LtrA n=1 Tax=Micromonospora avicenniae TaxID=1198245 RepID=A0A1N6VAC7_9ACTN|nr:low temperature requirement protein A [Micromonospora avicenniae]SIQ74833.1 Low temperature requirement protein LtrA [Micromonospora avicenniae]